MIAMPIGQLAKATGVKVPTIRFYEQIGLLPEPERTASDRRIYRDRDHRRLAFIKHARQLGFTVEAIRNLLDNAVKYGKAASVAIDQCNRRVMRRLLDERR
mgnify:CR=1 FL=1